MKIIILCKRRPQQKDLWKKPYGRFYHLAKHLADEGNEVHFLLLNYRTEPEFERFRNGMTWHSINLLPNPLKFYYSAKRLAVRIKADWIVGFSDTYFGIAAELIASRIKTRSLIDSYDNYESYLPYCLPLHWLWRRALKNSSAVTAAGPGLLELMITHRDTQRAVVIEMCADPHFTPGDRENSRKVLGLPIHRKIVAYTGSLYKSRGIKELFSLISQLSAFDPDIQWIISGRIESGIKLPANVHHLGYTDDRKVVDLLRSANAVLCVNRPDNFGDFSYPVKIYEALASGTPVIAFRTRSVEFVMRDRADYLVPFGDINAMVKKISEVIDRNTEVPPPTTNWSKQAKLLSNHMESWTGRKSKTAR
jgi:glycosyltransferase involved in cell wall biosynthesis